MTSRFYAIV